MLISAHAAETLALNALTWLVGQEDLLPVFMGATGSDQDDLRAGAANPEFLSSILDFLLMDDAWVIRFCDAHNLGYELPMQARYQLPGGAPVNWT